jgi:hypothetical protein
MRVRPSPRRFKSKLRWPVPGGIWVRLGHPALLFGLFATIRSTKYFFAFEMKEGGPGASGRIAIWFSTDFKATEQFFDAVVDGLNNAVKVTMRKSYPPFQF